MNKQIQIRLPVSTIKTVEAIAKLAGVTPTQVYNVMLAMSIIRGQGK